MSSKETYSLTEKNLVSVYNETTKPKTKSSKPKRKDKSDLGPDFVAPDGGWGWMVCFAAGFSNFAIFPPLQQYGLIYRQRMDALKFSPTETTTIVNFVMTISSVLGLVNGAMFRRFTFRQVALAGSVLVFLGIFTSAFATTFLEYVLSLSTVYSIGLGLCMAANSLAVNTYFKARRRRATGYMWTITGLGPIICPQISTFLLTNFGAQGSILIYSAITLNAVLCAIALQPVLWHVRKPQQPQNQSTDIMAAAANETAANKGSVVSLSNGNTMLHVGTDEPVYECKHCQYERRKRELFSSQYLLNEIEPELTGVPGTPMLARANDGWYGSKLSLSQTQSHGYNKAGLHESQCTCHEDTALLQQATQTQLKLEQEKLKAIEAEAAAQKENSTFKQKLVKFFDLDLLKDITFVNLALGMTIMMFAEMNFSVLTPFILNSYDFNDDQIAMAMSVLGCVDIVVRFLAPIVLEKVKLDNRVLFAFGILAIALGRFIVTFSRSYVMLLAVFALIGFGKGFRTIFAMLILPSYVPLNRLPAASGMQLIFNTIFSSAFGPLLGIVTAATNYTVTIHFLNCLTLLALSLWFIESIVRRIIGKPAVPMGED